MHVIGRQLGRRAFGVGGEQVRRVVTGDLGRSIRSGQPIGTALKNAVGPTAELTVLALLFGIRYLYPVVRRGLL